METCKKGLHPYAEGGCRECRNNYSKNLMKERRRAAGIPERVCIKGGSKEEANRRASKRWRLAHPAEYRALQKAVVEKVGLGYAARTMREKVGDVPVGVLEAKAALIRLKRQLRESVGD